VEKCTFLINADIRTKSESELSVQNTTLRKYIHELKEELKRMLGKSSNGEQSAGTKRNGGGQTIKMGEVIEDIKFNEEVTVILTEELLRLGKALNKASNVEYMVEIEDKIRKVKEETKLAEREKRNLEYLAKKDLYQQQTSHFYTGIDADSQRKIQVTSDRRE
jgi:hypothetical protein